MPPRKVSSKSRREEGTASVEAVAAVPFLLLALLVAAQIAIAGCALLEAAVAARRDARHALIRGGSGGVGRAPVRRLLRGAPAIEAEARTSLGGGDG